MSLTHKIYKMNKFGTEDKKKILIIIKYIQFQGQTRYDGYKQAPYHNLLKIILCVQYTARH
jgi:hypothetical protein